MRSWIKRIAALAILVGLGVVLTTTLRAGNTEAPQPGDYRGAKRTAVSKVGGPDYRTPLGPRRHVAAQGVVEPARRVVKVGAAQAGLVRRVLVAEGDAVKAGQPLVEFDAEVERAAVATTEADLAAAAAQAGRVSAGTRAEDRAALAAEARAASERAALAELNARRQALLKARGATTAADYDQARTQAEVERSTSAAVQARVAAASRPWVKDVGVAWASQRLAAARLAEARARLARLTVVAPTAGTVLSVITREGEYWTPGSAALVTLGDRSKVRVRLDVDERDVARVRPGQTGYVLADAFGDRPFPGKVVEVGRHMGRKNVRSDEPTERLDTRILEVVLELEDGRELVTGLRVVGFLEL